MTDQISPPERSNMAHLHQAQIVQLLNDYRNRYVLHTVPDPDDPHRLHVGERRDSPRVQVLPVL